MEKVTKNPEFPGAGSLTGGRSVKSDILDDMKEITTSLSSFRNMRKYDMLYVDKTEYIHALVRNPGRNCYFLSRPRRFGKSLFCSTLQAIFKERLTTHDNKALCPHSPRPFCGSLRE